jgi:hypothetical protein
MFYDEIGSGIDDLDGGLDVFEVSEYDTEVNDTNYRETYSSKL